MSHTVYLIDYENVHDTGLEGIHELNDAENVILFYTDHADKISLDVISDIHVPFHTIKVAFGKQSLDMHLVSYLGYLIGTETDPQTRYVIISRDTDFAGVSRFWCDRSAKRDKISIRPTIATKEIDSVVQPDNRVEISDFILRVMRQYGSRTQYGTYCMKFPRLCTFLNNSNTYLHERKHTGMKSARFIEEFSDIVIVKHIKNVDWVFTCMPVEEAEVEEVVPPASGEAAQPVTSEQQAETTESPVYSDESEKQAEVGQNRPEFAWVDELPSRLQLSGFSLEEAQTTAAIVHSCLGKTNCKMQLYNDMVSAFGGKQGLLLYRTIRGVLPEIYDTESKEQEEKSA
ncbi:MAG: hypothetical protein IJ708_14975 [Clostridia bacterium]|nr:hypothetical protein [Clostridia bacterium]